MSRHFSFAPCEILYLCLHGSSPTFLVSQPVFWITVCSRQTTAVCSETTGRVSVGEQQSTHRTHVLVFLWSHVGHFQSPLPAQEDDVLCCDNTKNPLSLLVWIISELFLFVMQKQNPNIRMLQRDEVGWATPLPTNIQARNLHLMLKAYSMLLLIWDREVRQVNMNGLMVACSVQLIPSQYFYPHAVALGDVSVLNCVFWNLSIYIANNSSNYFPDSIV